MSDMGETFRGWRSDKAKLRVMFGVSCPQCVALLPKAHPSILLPGQKCKIHNYRDLRPRITNEDRKAAGCEFMEVPR